MRDRAGTRRYLVLRRGRPGLGGILPDLLVQRVSKPPQTSSFSTVTSSTRSSSTASPELCFRVLWVHRDLLCAHLLPWATSCSPKTAVSRPHWEPRQKTHPCKLHLQSLQGCLTKLARTEVGAGSLPNGCLAGDEPRGTCQL